MSAATAAASSVSSSPSARRDIIGRQLRQHFLAPLPGEVGQELRRQLAPDQPGDGQRGFQRHVLDDIGEVGGVEPGKYAPQQRRIMIAGRADDAGR